MTFKKLHWDFITVVLLLFLGGGVGVYELNNSINKSQEQLIRGQEQKIQEKRSSQNLPEGSKENQGNCEYKEGEYEIRIYDAEGRVTGLIDGQVFQAIPQSVYWGDGRITLYFPFSYYEYEIFAVEGGNYQLNQTDTPRGGKEIVFSALNIPIKTGATHRYKINWQSLAENTHGVELFMDDDGDGEFEQTRVIEGTEFTCEEFLSE